MNSNALTKIACAMIVKDDTEYEVLDRALASVAPFVDGIFITGTKNPQKKIKRLCKKYGAHWSWFEWINDFSAARNFNWSQVPKEYQWIFWMDCDDVVVGAETFREAVKRAEESGLSQVFARYLYQVDLDEQGNVKNILIEHLRERLIKNDDHCEWVAAIHETIIEKHPVGKTDFMGFHVIHLSNMEDMVESMYRNIEILQEEVVRKPDDPRPIYYLAKAYFDTKEPMLLYEPLGEGYGSLTLELMKQYIRMSGWAEERAQAYEYISMIHREMGDHKNALKALLEALVEDPKFPSIYIQIALCYVMLSDWSKALHWIRLATTVEVPKTTLVVNPRDYKTMILEALFHIYLNTGQLDKCQKVAEGLVELLPTDLNKTRYAEILDLKSRNDTAHWVVKLATHLFKTGQTEELRSMIKAIPKEIASEPALVNLRNEFSPPKTWADDEVVIYCGPGYEQWSPKSAAKGIGGSEEAVINMGRELAKLGWRVTVYADPQDDAGAYDGVDYQPHYQFNIKDNFNIFIAWRQIGLFDADIKAKKSYLWNHDIQSSSTYTEARVNKMTKAFFLSKWHRMNVPGLAEEKVMYTANGINI